jgi:nicotinamidase-related amidase
MTDPSYLTPEFIGSWMAKRRLRDDLPFEPAESALMLVDLQRYFCEPEAGAFVPASAHIVPKLLELARLYAEHKRPIVLTRHIDDPAVHPMMAKWWKSTMKESDPETKLISALDPFLPNAILVTKHRYDPFFKTGLAQILRGRGVEQVVIGGVLTHLCCETAARAAFAHDFAVYFLIDGTATDTVEQYEGTLRNLGHGFAVLPTCGEIAEAIMRKSPNPPLVNSKEAGSK